MKSQPPRKKNDSKSYKGTLVITIAIALISLIVSTVLLVVGFSKADKMAGQRSENTRLYTGKPIEGLDYSLAIKAPALISLNSAKCEAHRLSSVADVELPPVSSYKCEDFFYIESKPWIERVRANRSSWPNHKEYDLAGFEAFQFGDSGQSMLINNDGSLLIYIQPEGRAHSWLANSSHHYHRQNEPEGPRDFEEIVRRLRI